jgi:hypothetical protein
MVFEKRAARRREPRNLEPVPQGVAIQEHPQHHHLVRLVEARRLEHPQPRPEPLDDALLARIEIPLGPAKSEPTAVRRSQRVRQIVSMQKLCRRRPPPELRPHAAIRLLHRGPASRQKPREQLLRLELHIEHAALRKRGLPAVEIPLQEGKPRGVGGGGRGGEREQMHEPARKHAVIAHEVDHLEPQLALHRPQAAAELLQEHDH